jgi:hypothetical protein
MDIERAKPVGNGRMWQPGQSGNPNGRPVGSHQLPAPSRDCRPDMKRTFQPS